MFYLAYVLGMVLLNCFIDVGLVFLVGFYVGFLLFSWGDLFMFVDYLSFGMIMLLFWLFLFFFFVLVMGNWGYSILKYFFFFFFFFFFFSLFFVFSVKNLFVFYLFFEVSLIPIFFFVLGMGVKEERLSAGVYMLLYTIFFSLPFLFGIFWLYNCVNTLDFFFVFYLGNNCFSFLVFFVFVLVFLVKLPCYGFHLWLPSAHVEASVGGSMILAGIMLKMGGYGLLRYSGWFLWGGFYQCYFYVFGIWGAFLISLFCLRSSDMKVMIAYSSVFHMSMLFSVWSLGKVVALLVVFFMMFSHGLISPMMFYYLNFFYERLKTRSVLIMRGSVFLFPFFVYVWFVVLIFNMGFPPFMSFFSEFLSLGLFLDFFGWFSVFLFFTLFLSGVYNMLFFVYVYLGEGYGFVSGVSGFLELFVFWVFVIMYVAYLFF